jgi:uncharacterized surface protein with fasciclin (FAS1) repeats
MNASGTVWFRPEAKLKEWIMKSLLYLALLGTIGSIDGQRLSASDNCCATPVAAASMSDFKDIVDTAVAAGSFKTLAAALKAADLIDTLKGKGPFTVFAPTDEAFAKLPKGTVEDLLKPENKKKLVKILTYHVVPGKVEAKDVVKLHKAKSVEGSEITISINGKKVKVDNANVVKTDVECENGVIHVIDAVILPK